MAEAITAVGKVSETWKSRRLIEARARPHWLRRRPHEGFRGSGERRLSVASKIEEEQKAFSYSPRRGINESPPGSRIPELPQGRHVRDDEARGRMTAKMSSKRREAFLRALEACGNQTLAAERAGVSRSWVCQARQRDPELDSDCRAAIAKAQARLDEAERRGPGGEWAWFGGQGILIDADATDNRIGSRRYADFARF